jgi:Ran GTPase-activating protein (RanGAP) involved in mRNA processing and transport
MLSLAGLEEIQEIHKTYEHCDFPEDKYDTVFSTTSIYWKAKGEDEKGEETKDEDEGKGKEKDESDKTGVKEGDEDELSKRLESTTIS